MKKVKDWVDKWIKQCGTQREEDDVLLIIKNGEKTIYEGHFLDVPDELYDYEVISSGQIIASSDEKRNGAYELETAVPQQKREEYLCSAVATRIQNLCKEKGCTINRLSTISNVTQSTVSDIVNGKSKNVGIITLYRLCLGLGINLEDFFSDELFRW